MRKYYLLVQLVFSTLLIYGQQNTLSLSQIDSIALSIDATKGLKKVASEGKINSTDIIMPQGHFTETFYAHPTSDKLVKVVRHAYFQVWDLYTYYYHNDQLVLVTALRHDKKGSEAKPMATGRYYFQDNNLIDLKESGKNPKEPNELLWQAKAYQRDVKTYFPL